MTVYLTCGHAANAILTKPNGDRVPSCAICLCSEMQPEPDLTGRTAECAYRCGAKMPSSLDLPFFEYRPNRETDRYYCGCWGWD